MTKKLFITGIILFLLDFMAGGAFAQQNSMSNYCFEMHIGFQSSFGPSKSQAEIVGGIDTIYYDNMKHFSPGFKSNAV